MGHFFLNYHIKKRQFDPFTGKNITTISLLKSTFRQYGENGTLKFNSSTHGQDPDRPEMRAFLIMRGPAFSENYTV